MQYRHEKTGMQNEFMHIVDALPLPGGHIDILTQSWCESIGLIADETCGQG
jgi:hypothetical protein